MTPNGLTGPQQWILYQLSAALRRIGPTLSVLDIYKNIINLIVEASICYCER